MVDTILSIVDLLLSLLLRVFRKIVERSRSSIGKAIQAVHKQKESVEVLADEIAKLYLTGQLSGDAYARSRNTYEKWAKAQATTAHSLASWRKLLDDASTR